MFVLTLLVSCLLALFRPTPAPVAAIVGGVLGGVIVVGGLVLVALFKTGRIAMVKNGRSPGPAAAAGGSAPCPAIPQYPTIPQHPAAAPVPHGG